MNATNTMIPPSTNIAEVYENSNDDDQEFVQNLALFLTGYLSQHLKIVERFPNTHELLINAHFYLIKISRVEDREIFKICLEYWAKLVQGLFEEAARAGQGSGQLLDLNSMGGFNGASRKNLYVTVLSNLRIVMIECMVKPEEVSSRFLWQHSVLTALRRSLWWRMMKARLCESL